MFLRVLTLTLFAGFCNVAFGTGPGLNVGPFQNEHFFFDTMAGGGGYGGKGGGGGGIAAVSAPLVPLVRPNFFQMTEIPFVQQQPFLTTVQSGPAMVAPVSGPIVSLGAAPVKGASFTPLQPFSKGGDQIAVPFAGQAFAPIQDAGQVVNVDQSAGPVFTPLQAIGSVSGKGENVAQAAGPILASIKAAGAFNGPAVAPVGGQVVNVAQAAGPAFVPVKGIEPVGGQVVNVAQATGPSFAQVKAAGAIGGPAFAPVQAFGPVGGQFVNVAQATGQGVGPVGGQVVNVAQGAGPAFASVKAAGAVGGPAFAPFGGQGVNIGPVQVAGAAFAPVQAAGDDKGEQRAVFVGTPASVKGGNIRMVNFATAPLGMALPLRRNIIANAPIVNNARVPVVSQMIIVPQSEQVSAVRPFIGKAGAPLLRPGVAQANTAFIPNTINAKGNINTVNVRPFVQKQNVRILPRVVATNRVEKPIIAPPTVIRRQPVDGGTFVVNAPSIRLEAQAPQIAPTKTVETNPINAGTVVLDAPPVQLGPDRVVAPAQTIDGGNTAITQNIATLEPPPQINVVDNGNFVVPQVAPTNILGQVPTTNDIAQQPVGPVFNGPVSGGVAEPGLIPLISNPTFAFQNNLQPFMTQRQFIGAPRGGVVPNQIGVGGPSVVFPQGVQGLSRFSNIEGRFESGLINENDDLRRFQSAGLNGGIVGPEAGVGGISGVQQFPGTIGGTFDGQLDNRIDDSRLVVAGGPVTGGGLVDPLNTAFNDGRSDFIDNSRILNTAAGNIGTGPVIASNGIDNFVPEAFAFEDKTGGVVKTPIKKEKALNSPATKMSMTKETKTKEQEVVNSKSEPNLLISGSKTKSVMDGNSVDITDVQSSVIITNEAKLPTEDVVKADGSLDMTVVSVNTDQKRDKSKVNIDSTSVNAKKDAKVLFTTPKSTTS